MRVDKIESKPAGKDGSKPARGHVHEHVLHYMRRGLMVGAFLPGQVMSLRKLAAGLGTSPMPVREVLSRLVAANALEETKGGSVRVPRLSPEKLRDLFSVREVLGAVERVAGHGFEVRQAPRRAGDPASVVSNPALIKKTLGWVPAYDDLDTIVTHAMAWEKRLMERNR